MGCSGVNLVVEKDHLLCEQAGHHSILQKMCASLLPSGPETVLCVPTFNSPADGKDFNLCFCGGREGIRFLCSVDVVFDTGVK
jgi:hypothetical protein